MSEIIIGYKWEVWYSGSCLREDDEVFDTEEEAIAEATGFCKDRIEQWKLDGANVEDDDLDELIKGIVINDVTEGEED